MHRKAATRTIRSLDPGFAEDGSRLVELIDAAEDLGRTLARYADAIEDDPSALDTVEERLLLLADLKRKYGATLAEVQAYRDQADARLAEIDHREADAGRAAVGAGGLLEPGGA